MNQADALKLQGYLLDRAKVRDEEAIAAENLPQGTLLLLRKLTAMDGEIRSLAAMVERKEEEERELSDLLLQQLQQLP